MKDFKFLRNNTPFFEGMEIVRVGPLMYNPESFNPQREVTFRDEYGFEYMYRISTDHPRWNELRHRYP